VPDRLLRTLRGSPAAGQTGRAVTRPPGAATASIFGAGLIYSASLHMFQTLAPLYLSDRGFSPAALGALIAFPSLFQIFMRIPGGMAADRLGERTVLFCSAASMGAAALMFMNGRLGWIIVAQGLTGVSRAVFWPSAQSYVTKLPGADVGRSLGLFNTFTGAGNAVGPVVAGLTLAWLGFNGSFGVMCATAGLSIGAVALMPGLTAAHRTRRKPRPLIGSVRAMRGNRPVLLAAVCRYAAAFPVALLGSFLPVYLAETGMDPRQIGLLSGLRGLSLTAASLALAVVFDRLPRPLVWLGGMSGLAVSVILIPSLTGFLPLAACVALMGLGSAAMQILPLAMIAESTEPGERATVIAMTGTLWGLSLFVNPVLFGAIAQTVSTAATFYVGGAPLAVLAALTPPLFRWGYGAGRDRLPQKGDEHDS